LAVGEGVANAIVAGRLRRVVSLDVLVDRHAIIPSVNVGDTKAEAALGP
jgi:hypothetical protein